MATVVILNVVLAVLIVAAVLSLLGWGILTDKGWADTRPFRHRTTRVRSGAPRRSGRARAAASGHQ
jgi:hypothetical protein